MEDDLKWKMTSKYEKQNISATTGWILLKLETKDYGTKPKGTKVSNEDNIKLKTTQPKIEDNPT